MNRNKLQRYITDAERKFNKVPGQPTKLEINARDSFSDGIDEGNLKAKVNGILADNGITTNNIQEIEVFLSNDRSVTLKWNDVTKLFE